MLVTLEQDEETGDLILPLPDDILTSLGVGIGDRLIWEVVDNGTIKLRGEKDEDGNKG